MAGVPSDHIQLQETTADRMSMSNLNISVENDQLILYKISLSGNLAALEELLQQDELILDRVSVTSFHETPLHIAAMRGHLHFAKALLSRKPKLASELDSLCRLPLHLACAEGYLEIVKELLHACPSACSARDQDGRVPLHLAAMKGRVEIIKELLRTCPESIKERVYHGETILHLCVKYNRLEALRLLVEEARDDHELVNASDDNGNTILHLSAIHKQVEATKYLLLQESIKTKAKNKNGFTALDAIEHCPGDSKGLEIQIILLEAGVQRSNYPNLNNALLVRPSEAAAAAPPPQKGCCYFIGKIIKWLDKYFENVGKRLEEARGHIIVAATVTASITYQAGINPPRKDKDTTPTAAPSPGDKIYYAPSDYDFCSSDPEKNFWLYNTSSLMLSLVLILAILSGIPMSKKISRFVYVVIMGLTILFISKAYVCAGKLIFPDKDRWSDLSVLWPVLQLLFILIMGIHVIVFPIYLVRKICKRFSLGKRISKLMMRLYDKIRVVLDRSQK